MEAITKQGLIDSIAERWDEVFKPNAFHSMDLGIAGEARGRSPLQVYNELKVLPQKATEEMVTKIIGNDSWTGNICSECRQDSEVTILLGIPDDDDAANVCLSCLKKAMALAEQAIS